MQTAIIFALVMSGLFLLMATAVLIYIARTIKKDSDSIKERRAKSRPRLMAKD